MTDALRRMVRAKSLALGLITLGTLSGVAQAQRPTVGAPAGSPAARADSIAAMGDTTHAIALLDSAVRRNKKDATSWYLYGLLNWERARSGRDPNYIKDQKVVRMLSAADTALKLATQFAPDSARYWLALSRFNLQSGLSTMRFAANGQTGNAFEAATKTGDRLLLAQAADQLGWAAWRRYDAVANRALTQAGNRLQVGSNNNWPRTLARDYVKSIANKIEPPTGKADYNEALEKFRTAVGADSTNLRFSRHLYMALAEHKRWEELLDVGTRRSAQFPLDAQARLARGLALHRLQRFADAKAAFDSAMTMMDEEERGRLTRFTRILRPRPTKESKTSGGDSAAYSKLPEGQRKGLEEMYWYMNDPLTLTNENEYRLEFLSRIVFADFRWTDEDMGLKGADTDRGDVYVRYGPPDMELSVTGNATFTYSGDEAGVTLVWSYNAGLTFFFDLTPGFATARYSLNDRDAVEQIKNNVPVSWANMPTTQLIDTIPVRIARFRAGHDSTDALVAVRMPLDSLLRGLDLERVPLDVDFRVFDQFVRVRGVESSQLSLRPDSVRAPLERTWTRRLGPGINIVRVEALQGDSRRAARAMSQLMPFATTGFGMSDVLLGSKPEPRDATRAPRSWRDVEMAPGSGVFARGAPIGLMWELYDLTMREGTGKYRVSIAVERAERGGAGGFAVKLFDNLGRAVGRTQQGRDKFTITFDRQASQAGTAVDYLSLAMTDAPAGLYHLRVEILDLGSQKRTTRSTEFTIR
jgi:GWxTD domain-containing protein